VVCVGCMCVFECECVSGLCVCVACVRLCVVGASVCSVVYVRMWCVCCVSV